ncbi:MAG: hypothetical protein CMG09_03480 [Candidatus Marinimicrobia bacterium]|nr:hypothetical protein [Candidatus Neomarinimicrobiota bacterium]|tara:strand:- start:88 stop:525 length:438 start_codon:yes stop_codon:yes gene_type:complete
MRLLTFILCLFVFSCDDDSPTAPSLDLCSELIGEWETSVSAHCTTNPGACGGNYNDEVICYWVNNSNGSIYNFYENGTYEFIEGGNDEPSINSYNCSSTEILFDDWPSSFDFIINGDEVILSVPCNENECEFCPYDSYILLNRIN